ncbi:hypothetical protein Taro_023606 [Colocasia esculenta]|uniref:Uncharacterized protein n=1 Tax=Colocasia esculenta TaxID=4460 RepID=A0A843V547_COLES|nr:hypothetical protein [Colocasia esculenta]
MCKTVEEAAQRAATLERSIRTRQVGESGSGSFRLPQQSVGASRGKAPAGPSSSGFGKWGQKLKQAFKGKGRGWGGRPQFQQGRGRPEVEESQQSTASNVTSRAFRIHADHVCCGCGGRCEANVSWLCGMYGVDLWLEQVKCRVGPEMK